MKVLYVYLFGLLSFFALVSCEELIDVNLNEADPRIVIDADLNNLSNKQVILVSRTVPFDDRRHSEPINDGIITVQEDHGKIYDFILSSTPGRYVHRNFSVRPGASYKLKVIVDDNIYESTEVMPEFVEVDSIGVVIENFFGDDYYFATLKFNDPAGIPNYYKYNISLNGGRFQFFAVFNDKFNDGLSITHQVTDPENKMSPGDSVVVRRQLVSRNVYRYWNDLQSTNPGSAAPANPTSNISNGALGYFGVSNVREYTFDMQNINLGD